jgi:hypothetical protein
MNDMLEAIWVRWAEYVSDPQQRKGQALMNAIYQVDPNAYESVRANSASCFYDDNKIYLTLNHLVTEYGDK